MLHTGNRPMDDIKQELKNSCADYSIFKSWK
ncbi:MAG: hypothetical protein JWQ21_3371 [Herminiimonas sp.]|nr:hypothetical protein [Herminiimonas sp.]